MTEKKKILFVEDEQSTRKAIGMKLEEAGFEVFLAEEGEMGLEIAEKNLPDLILSDVIMPKMHGLDMLNVLKSEKWGKDIPVIILTNYADDPKVLEAEKEKKCIVVNKTKTKISEIIFKIKEELNI